MCFSFRPWDCGKKDYQGFAALAFLEIADKHRTDMLILNNVSISKIWMFTDITVLEEEDRFPLS
jgi:hypothetical protein